MSRTPMLKPAEIRLICTVWGAGVGILLTVIMTMALLEYSPEQIEGLRDQQRPFGNLGGLLFLMLLFPACLGGVLWGVLAWKAMRPGDDSPMSAAIRGGGVGATLAIVTPMVLDMAAARYWRIVAPSIQGYEWRCYVLLILTGLALGAVIGAIVRRSDSPTRPVMGDVDLRPFHARKDDPPSGDDQITRPHDTAVTRHGELKGEEERAG